MPGKRLDFRQTDIIRVLGQDMVRRGVIPSGTASISARHGVEKRRGGEVDVSSHPGLYGQRCNSDQGGTR